MPKENFVETNGVIQYMQSEYDNKVAYLFCRTMNNERRYRISQDKIQIFLSLTSLMDENDVFDKEDTKRYYECIILLYHNNMIAWKFKATKADCWMYMANFNKYAVDTLNHIKEKCLEDLNTQKDTILLQTKKDLENVIIL